MKKLMCAFTAACLVLALTTLSSTAHAQQGGLSSQSGNLDFTGAKIAIVVGAIAVGAAVVITVVVLHKHSEKKITGCAVAGLDGMGLTDERDNRLYRLVGDTAGIKPGERVTLHLKKIKMQDAGRSVGWQPRKSAQDLGPCKP